MDWKQLFQKLRPTAVVFGLIMGALTWILIHYLIAGPIGQAAFGGNQAGAIIATALIVVGVAIGSLGNGLLKLCEDAPPDPPATVPENSHQALIELIGVAWTHNPQIGQQLTVQEIDGNRPREGIGADESA